MQHGNSILSLLVYITTVGKLKSLRNEDFWSFIEEPVRVYKSEELHEIVNEEKKVLLNFLLFSIALPVIGVIAFAFHLWRITDKYAGVEEETKRRKKPRPKKMESAKINSKEFIKTKPLVHMRSFQGEIKHALDKEKSLDLAEVKFDPLQNEITAIGSQIDMFDSSQRRTLEEKTKSMRSQRSKKKETGQKTSSNHDPKASISQTVPSETTSRSAAAGTGTSTGLLTKRNNFIRMNTLLSHCQKPASEINKLEHDFDL